jgi:hypothetical protein
MIYKKIEKEKPSKDIELERRKWRWRWRRGDEDKRMGVKRQQNKKECKGFRDGLDRHRNKV